MNQKDSIGNIAIIIFLILLIIAGFYSYKSIDWTVLDRIEKQPLILPTPIPATNSAIPTATTSTTSKK